MMFDNFFSFVTSIVKQIMPYFDQGNSVSQDDCALQLRNNENSSMCEYLTSDLKGENACDTQLFLENPNLRCRNGFGFASSHVIDCDTRLRHKDPSHIRGPDKRQLYARMFTDVPDMSVGTFIPNVESRLIMGHDTFVDHGCRDLTELQFDIYQPFTRCTDNYIQGWTDSIVHEDENTRLGVPTRDMKQCNLPKREVLQKKGKSALPLSLHEKMAKESGKH